MKNREKYFSLFFIFLCFVLFCLLSEKTKETKFLSVCAANERKQRNFSSHQTFCDIIKKEISYSFLKKKMYFCYFIVLQNIYPKKILENIGRETEICLLFKTNLSKYKNIIQSKNANAYI